MSHTISETLGLSKLLAGMSVQMDSLATEVHRIEHAIGDELAMASTPRTQTITRLQRLDFLRQSLEDLALLLHFLSKDHNGVLELNLSEKLRLDVTKALFKDGCPMDPALLPDEKIRGDVDLF